jgi:YidC/Oxa1 family membrane protein insertase
MQRIQPKLQKIREKYKNDRAEMNRQMMALQQEEGFNPLTGCLPLLLQIPVFLGLFHVLRHLSNSVTICRSTGTLGSAQQHLLSLYTFSGGRTGETCDAAKARIFGAPLAASFHDSSTLIRQLLGDPTSTRVTIGIMLVISAAATLGTQLLARANQTTPPEGTAATMQRLMLYIIPVGVLASGLLFNFPLGVLLYWFTSNIWTLGQQGYIIRFHPPKEEPEKPVGELGRALAPKPGQRPVRLAKGKTTSEASVDEVAAPPDDTAAGSTAVRSTAPRPGQRPNRPSGKRPPAKRPTQAKKRR